MTQTPTMSRAHRMVRRSAVYAARASPLGGQLSLNRGGMLLARIGEAQRTGLMRALVLEFARIDA